MSAHAVSRRRHLRAGRRRHRRRVRSVALFVRALVEVSVG